MPFYGATQRTGPAGGLLICALASQFTVSVGQIRPQAEPAFGAAPEFWPNLWRPATSATST